MPETYTITIDGEDYDVDWSRPTPPTPKDFDAMANGIRGQSAAPGLTPDQARAFLNAAPTSAPPVQQPTLRRMPPAPPPSTYLERQQRAQGPYVTPDQIMRQAAYDRGEMVRVPREELPTMGAYVPPKPNAVERALEMLGNVLGAPKAAITESMRQADLRLVHGDGISPLPGMTLSLPGANPGMTPEDTEYNKHLDTLPMGQRILAQVGKSWLDNPSEPSVARAKHQGTERQLSGIPGQANAFVQGAAEIAADPMSYVFAGTNTLLRTAAKGLIAEGGQAAIRGTRILKGIAAGDTAFAVQMAAPYILDPSKIADEPGKAALSLLMAGLGGAGAIHTLGEARGGSPGAEPVTRPPVNYDRAAVEALRPENAQMSASESAVARLRGPEPIGAETKNAGGDTTQARSAATPEPKYKFSSTQVNLPPDLAESVDSVGKRLIPDTALTEDGREQQPHITVKYGLHTNEVEPVRAALQNEPPIQATLGKTSIFPASESGAGDVVKVDVDSPDLHRLNRKIADALEHTDTHPTYQPHVTLAYVKAGEGAKFAGDASLEGRPVTLDRVVFSDRNGNQIEIPLEGKPQEISSGQSTQAPGATAPKPDVSFGAADRPAGQSAVVEGPATVATGIPERPGRVSAPAEVTGRPGQRIRMTDVENAMREFGIDLPDRKTFGESWQAAIDRASANYDDILASLKHYTPDTTELPTREERAVAAMRLQDVTQQLSAALDGGNQARIDALMAETSHLGNLLYRSGSEAGRSLAFQKALFPDPTSPAAVLMRAEKATDGKLTTAARTTLVRLSEEAKTVKAETDAKVQARAKQNRAAQGVPQDLPAGFGEKNKVFTRDKADAARQRLQKKFSSANAGFDPTMLADLVEIGGYYLEGGVRKFGDWAQRMRQDVDQSLDDTTLQHVWANVKAEAVKDGAVRTVPAPETFADELARRVGRERAAEILNTLQEERPGVLGKLITGEDLTTEEQKFVGETYLSNTRTKGAPMQASAAMKTLADIANEMRTKTVPPKPKPITAGQMRARANATLNRLGTTQPKRPPSYQVDEATLEYAAGARDLQRFAVAMRKRYGQTIDDAAMQNLFSEAAQQYARDYKQLDAIKSQMARVVAQEIYKAKPFYARAGIQVANIANAGRSVLTSFDLSFPLRQGLILSAANPRMALRSFAPMLKAFGSEHVAEMVKAEIMARPNADIYQKAGLYLSDVDEPTITAREENYQSDLIGRANERLKQTQGAAKVATAPLRALTEGVLGSERAYTTFANKLRADTFDMMLRDVERGVGRKATDAEARAIADFINNATGRGDVANVVKSGGTLLSTVFFSPRFLASRLRVLALTGVTHGGGSASTRLVIARTYAQAAATMLAVFSLAKMGGAQVNTDPRSGDFLKMKWGNTEFDGSASLAGLTTFLSRLATGEKVTQRGDVQDLTGGKYGAPTRLSLGQDFLRGKLAPIPSAAANLLAGKDLGGNPASARQEAIRNVVPITAQDIYRAAKQEGIPSAIAVGLAGTFGVSAGVQAPPPPKKSAIERKLERRLKPRTPRLKSL